MRWWMLSGIQYSLAHCPGGAAAYGALQRRFGELKNIRGSSRFDKAALILHQLAEHGDPIEGRHIVEFGTGWVPVVPLALAVAGAKVSTYDVAPLVDDALYRQSRDELSQRLPEYARAARQNAAVMRKRFAPLAECHTFAEACDALAISYDGEADTTQLALPSESVDMVVSSLVLQCMPVAALDGVLAESFRILAPGGIAFHRIRMTDENAAHDDQRNHFDYLKYSPEEYDRWFNHRLKHLNRLRASQFLSKMRRCGFDVLKATREIDHDSLDYVSQLDVDPMFANLTAEDLATTNLDVALVKSVPWNGLKPVNRPDLHDLGQKAAPAESLANVLSGENDNEV